MWLFIAGLFYGIVFLLSLGYFFLLTAVVYDENIKPILEENGLDVLFIVPILLGRWRSLAWTILAFLWPITLTVLFLSFTLIHRGKSIEELSPRSQRLILWIFLGFGKKYSHSTDMSSSG